MYPNAIAKRRRQSFANQLIVVGDHQTGKCQKGVQFALMEIGMGG